MFCKQSKFIPKKAEDLSMRKRGNVGVDLSGGSKPPADHAEKRMKPMMLTVLIGGAALVVVRLQFRSKST